MRIRKWSLCLDPLMAALSWMQYARLGDDGNLWFGMFFTLGALYEISEAAWQKARQ